MGELFSEGGHEGLEVVLLGEEGEHEGGLVGEGEAGGFEGEEGGFQGEEVLEGGGVLGGDQGVVVVVLGVGGEGEGGVGVVEKG